MQILLREAVRYNETVDESEDDIIMTWIDKLEPVTEDNIEEQTFIIELLGFQVNNSI